MRNLASYFPTQNQTELSQRGKETVHRRRDAGAGHLRCDLALLIRTKWAVIP